MLNTFVPLPKNAFMLLFYVRLSVRVLRAQWKVARGARKSSVFIFCCLTVGGKDGC